MALHAPCCCGGSHGVVPTANVGIATAPIAWVFCPIGPGLDWKWKIAEYFVPEGFDPLLLLDEPPLLEPPLEEPPELEPPEELELVPSSFLMMQPPSSVQTRTVPIATEDLEVIPCMRNQTRGIVAGFRRRNAYLCGSRVFHPTG